MKKVFIAFCCLVGFAFWHQPLPISIEGYVLDLHSGQSLTGVMIKVLGSTKSTLSDPSGFYQINLDEGENTVIFSLDGYTIKRIRVTKSQVLNIQMVKVGATPENETDQEPDVPQHLTNTSPMHTKIRTMNYAGAVYESPMPLQNWNTEDYDFIRENSFLSTSDQPVSTFSIDVDRAAYSNVRRFLNQGTKPPVDAVRIEEMINYFDYDYPKPVNNEPVAIYIETGACPWSPAHQLVHLGVQSKKIDLENLPASHLVFLIDVSGSMQAPNKLPLLISSFHLLVNQLRKQDRISLVTYAGSDNVVLRGVSGNQKEIIFAALDNLQSGGSTAGADGILSAYAIAKELFIEGGNNRVILATDGDFNIGVSSDSELVRMIEEQKKSGVFLSVLGFGMGNYKDNKMQKLADSGNGSHYYIDDLQEARKVFVNEFGGTLFTVAKDVKIQVEFNPDKVAGYRLIGYENRKLENRDFNDDKKDAGEIGNGHTVTALYEIIPKGVESKWINQDGKRYTSIDSNRINDFNDELGFIKLRYKDPDALESHLLEKIIHHKGNNPELSDNFFWSAAVAGFGMVLRGSEFKQAADENLVLRLANKSKGKDTFGYRSEFIYLVESWQRINGINSSDEQQTNRD